MLKGEPQGQVKLTILSARLPRIAGVIVPIHVDPSLDIEQHIRDN